MADTMHPYTVLFQYQGYVTVVGERIVSIQPDGKDLMTGRIT